MKHWAVQDARAKFSELVYAAENEGPQVVTRRGIETVVVVSAAEWKRMSRHSHSPENRPSLMDLLLHDPRRFELDIPPRGQWKHREPPELE